MAPSIQQLPEETHVVSPEKLVPVSVEALQEGPKVKRQIDLEGGKTDAKVRLLKFTEEPKLTLFSTLSTYQRGITVKSTLLLSHLTTSNMVKM
jgi:hypothetical protein